MPFELTLADRNMQVRFSLKVVLEFCDLIFFGITTSFQKSNIGWPQQPPTEKMLLAGFGTPAVSLGSERCSLAQANYKFLAQN